MYSFWQKRGSLLKDLGSWSSGVLEGCRVGLGLSLALEYMPNSTETLPHVPYALCYLDTCHVSARNLDCS